MLHSQQEATQYRHTDVTEHLRCQLQLTAPFTDWHLYSELLQCTLREVPAPALGAPTPAGPSVRPPAQPSPGFLSHFTQDSVNATSSESLPDHTFWGQPAPTLTLCPFTRNPFCGLHSLQLRDLKVFFLLHLFPLHVNSMKEGVLFCYLLYQNTAPGTHGTLSKHPLNE